ncbi:MAG TPA: SIS domain-containing protein [Candidatus Limnocylindrales bacterium]
MIGGRRPARATLMAGEIGESPAVVERVLSEGGPAIAAAAAAFRRSRPRWATVVARGTSDHAGIYGRFLIETQLRIPVGLASPSVTTIYETNLRWRGGLLLAISQSGQSPDIVGVTAAARAGGALTIAVTNEPDSPLAAAAAHVIPCLSGEERAVAATKTYSAELAGLAGFVGALVPRSPLARALGRLPDELRRVLAVSAAWVAGDGDELVGQVAASGRAIVASRGFDLATALEIALKLKETSHVFAEGYSTADLEHGPVALAGPSIPTLILRPDGRMGAAIDPAIRRVEATGSRPWRIGGRETATGGRALGLAFDLPEALSPLAFILPGQLLAEAVARSAGFDPDAPKGLTKVTRTS